MHNILKGASKMPSEHWSLISSFLLLKVKPSEEFTFATVPRIYPSLRVYLFFLNGKRAINHPAISLPASAHMEHR